MEILAQKKQGSPWQNVTLIIAGVFSILAATAIAVLLLTLMDNTLLPVLFSIIMLVAVGVFLITVNAIAIHRIKRTPNCITLNGNQVDLGNGLTVNVSQITDVDCRESRARYYSFTWGTLYVYLGNQKLEYYYVENVRHSRDMIMQLILQTKFGK